MSRIRRIGRGSCIASGCGRRLVEALERRTLLSVTLSLQGPESLSLESDPAELQHPDPSQTTSHHLHESETMTVVNRADPMQVATVFMYSGNEGGTYSIREFDSTDGGKTWSAATDFTSVPSADPDAGLGGATMVYDNQTPGQGTRVDPSIAFDARGDLFVSYLYLTTPQGGQEIGRIVVFQRLAGATTFSNMQTVTPAALPDKDMITAGADGSDPAHQRQAVYLTYDEPYANVAVIAVGWQEDSLGNLIASPSNQVQVPNAIGEFAQPVVDGSGNLFVAWTVDPPMQFSREAGGMFASGASFDPSPTTIPNAVGYGSVVDIDRRTGALELAYVDTTTIPNASLVTVTGCANPMGAPASWTRPVAVDTANLAAVQSEPWLSVDEAAGTVSVLYYTTDGDSPTNPDNVRPRLTTLSENGLTTLLAHVNVTDQSFNPDSVPDSLKLRDYIGLAAYDGTVHLSWAGLEPTDPYDPYVYVATGYEEPGGTQSPANVLAISGDPGGDSVTVRRNTDNSNYLQILINGQLQFNGLAGVVGQIQFNATGATDALTVDATYGNPVPGLASAGPGLVYNGSTASGASNGLTVIGPPATGNDLFVNAPMLTLDGAGVSFQNLTAMEVDVPSGDNYIEFDSALPFTPVVRSGAGGGTTTTNVIVNAQLTSLPTFTGGANSVDDLAFTAGTYTINADLGVGHSNLTVEDESPLVFSASQNFYQLHIEQGGTATVSDSPAGAPYVLTLSSILIDGPSGGTYAGTLDLNNNNVWINFGANPDPMPQIFAYLKTGYDLGAWDGTGIMSSAAAASGGTHALGYIDLSTLTQNPTNQIYVAYCRYGDTNLDNTVNFTDLLALTQNYGDTSGTATWAQGDFTYDGDVTFPDYLLLAQNYNKAT